MNRTASISTLNNYNNNYIINYNVWYFSFVCTPRSDYGIVKIYNNSIYPDNTTLRWLLQIIPRPFTVNVRTDWNMIFMRVLN